MDTVKPAGHRHSQAPTGMLAEKDLGTAALFGRELIRGHQVHRGARKDSLSTAPSFVQHHPAEGEVVIDRRSDIPGPAYAACLDKYVIT